MKIKKKGFYFLLISSKIKRKITKQQNTKHYKQNTNKTGFTGCPRGVYGVSPCQNYFEGFGLGGGGGGEKGSKDKKENKPKGAKMVEAVDKENAVLEDSLNISDNKNDYIEYLAGLKRKEMLSALDHLVKSGGGVGMGEIDLLIEFLGNE